MSFTPPLPVESRPEPLAWGETLACERGLLGAVLHDPSLDATVRKIVASEDFSMAVHARLFEALPRLIGPDRAVDHEAVSDALGAYAWDAEGGVGACLDRLLSERAVPELAAHLARGIHMSAEKRRTVPEPIDVDTAAWSHRQAALLARLAERSDELSRAVDWASVIEEVLYVGRSVGRSQTGGVVRKMELVFAHLVKLLADPNAPSRDRRRGEIDAFRMRIAREAKPAMRRLIDLDAAWRQGVSDAAADLAEYAVRLPRDLPKACPFTFDEMTAGTPTVTALLEKLAATGDMKSSQQP